MILFDGHWAGNFNGISTYSDQIFKRAHKYTGSNYSIATSKHLGYVNEVVLHSDSNYFWEQLSFPIYAKLKRADVVFYPDWRNSIFSPYSYVLTVHDLIFFICPELFKNTKRYKFYKLYKNWISNQIKNASHVITVSNYSKLKILEYFPHIENKTSVIYSGVDINSSLREIDEEKRVLKKFHIDAPFFLTVGRIDYNKNYIFLCDAFLKSRFSKDFILVICGNKVNEHFLDLVNFLQKKDLKKRIHLISNVSNDELSNIYKSASLFIMPSLHEGFGLPIIEAMSFGVPVIAANNSSLPEVVNFEDALFCNNDFDSLVEKIEKFVYDKEARVNLVDHGFKNIKRFSWENCAMQTCHILNKFSK